MPGKHEAASPFVVMAKPVGARCNMRCAYCYYLGKEKFSSRPDQTRMSDDVLERFIRQYMEAAPGGVVCFTWHGGEPTLAGLPFYKKVVALQKKYLPAGKECWNSLQTNGILLNEAWCTFLSENRFDVGLSIDGCQSVHDANRRDRGGAPTWEKVVRAAGLLRQAGISPDLLCTVNSESEKSPLEVYRALRELETGWIQFIPIVLRGEGGELLPGSVSPEGYGTFLCQIFDEWLTRDLGRLDVQVFAEAARVWAGGEASLCWMAPVCGRVPVVEQDGSVFACDHFVEPDYRLGSLRTEHLADLVDLPRQAAFGNSKRDGLPAECLSCPHLAVCNGGCPKDRFAETPSGGKQYILCPGLRSFFDHASGPMRRVMELSRKGLKPPAIRKAMAQELAKTQAAPVS